MTKPNIKIITGCLLFLGSFYAIFFMISMDGSDFNWYEQATFALSFLLSIISLAGGVFLIINGIFDKTNL